MFEDEQLERALFALLLDEYPVWWSRDELLRSVSATGESFAARDRADNALRELVAAGVVHVRDGMYVPTRAAIRAATLAD